MFPPCFLFFFVFFFVFSSKKDKNIGRQHPLDDRSEPGFLCERKKQTGNNPTPPSHPTKTDGGHRRHLRGDEASRHIKNNQNRGGEKNLLPRHPAEKEEPAHADYRRKQNSLHDPPSGEIRRQTSVRQGYKSPSSKDGLQLKGDPAGHDAVERHLPPCFSHLTHLLHFPATSITQACRKGKDGLIARMTHPACTGSWGSWSSRRTAGRR